MMFQCDSSCINLVIVTITYVGGIFASIYLHTLSMWYHVVSHIFVPELVLNENLQEIAMFGW